MPTKQPAPPPATDAAAPPHPVRILDTAPEERFDRITRTAQRLFGTPIAFISLIDQDRRWLKSAQGTTGNALPHWIPFCSYATPDIAPLVIEDAAADPCFAASPLVTEAPHVRFFAAWALHDAAGMRVGTLAIADSKPRTLGAPDIETLHDLVEWTESELNNRSLQRALVAAKDSQARMHAVVDNVADGIITLDEYGIITSVNPAAVRIFGYHPEELIGHNIKILMPAAYHQTHDGHLKRFRDTGRTAIIGTDREVTGRRKDGSLFAMELTVNQMSLAGRRGFVGILRDITIRREAERRVLENSALLRTVMGCTSSFVYVRDLEGRFLYVNKEYERVCGFQPDQIIGRKVGEVFPPAFARYSLDMDRAIIERGPTARIEDEVQFRDGEQIFLVVRSPLVNEKGRVYGVCGVGTDITLRKKAEQVKNEFISTVSHELRTPLTSIRGSLGLLTGGVAGDIPARAKSLLEIANNNCERLVRLINDILDIEKIESGHMRFEMLPQRMLPLIEQALAETQHYAQQYQVRFELQTEAPDVHVNVDGDRIVQVIVNLLSNAAKFSPTGGSVQVRLKQLSDCARLSIVDHGAGIDPAFRERIFQKFAQADSSDSRQKGGTGLGLSISRAIVDRHHGRIDFNSTPGAGTEFFVELPLGAGSSVPTVRCGRVLICEDDPDIARLLGLMLAQSGLSSDVACDADQARCLLATGKYEAMTLDLALPHEDGLSLLRWMRAQDAYRGLPVVVVSALAEEGRCKLTCGAVGIVDWISKPIDELRLRTALQDALRGCKDDVPRVLHVEDDHDLVEVVTALLHRQFAVKQAASLAEARVMLAEENFSLILLDLLLPDGHGSELLGSLPARNAATPVVVFSVEEANQPMLDSVHAALVKSRTSNEQLLSILHDLMHQTRMDDERKP